MDISQFTVPQSLVPLFVGLVFLGVGGWLVGTKNLFVRLLGLVIAVGAMSVFLTPFPSDWISTSVKGIIVILVFIGFSAEGIASTDWNTSPSAKLTGVVLTLIGVLALIVQVKSYYSLPTGSLQQVINEGFDSLSRIFNLAGKQLE